MGGGGGEEEEEEEEEEEKEAVGFKLGSFSRPSHIFPLAVFRPVRAPPPPQGGGKRPGEEGEGLRVWLKRPHIKSSFSKQLRLNGLH